MPEPQPGEYVSLTKADGSIEFVSGDRGAFEAARLGHPHNFNHPDDLLQAERDYHGALVAHESAQTGESWQRTQELGATVAHMRSQWRLARLNAGALATNEGVHAAVILTEAGGAG